MENKSNRGVPFYLLFKDFSNPQDRESTTRVKNFTLLTCQVEYIRTIDEGQKWDIRHRTEG